jgi:hypothetical protein
MASLRSLAACIGVTGEFSVVGDFFGHASPPPWRPVSSDNIPPSSLSLLTQIRRLQQPYFNINVVRVGTNSDGIFAGEGVDDIDDAVHEKNVDAAVALAREIYGAIGVGIGRVERCGIRAAETHYEVIDTHAEAAELVDEEAIGNDGMIDVFLVKAYLDASGKCPPKQQTGVVVVSDETDFRYTAHTFSHELGHFFLGGGHKTNEPTNLMTNDAAATVPTSTLLNANQTKKIKKHDKIHDAC